MINLYINDVLKSYKPGFYINKHLNETLDTGTIVIPQSLVFDIEPMDEVLIRDTAIGYAKYMLVSDIKRSISSYVAPRKYNYELGLISPTIILQGIVLPNRSITQPLIGTPRTIYYYLAKYIEIYAPTLTLSSALIAKTDTVTCPEIHWDRPTLYEVFNDLLVKVNCVVSMSTFTEISCLDLAATGSVINTALIHDEQLTQSIDNYVNTLEIEAKNVVYNTVNVETFDVITVRTTADSVLSTDNGEIILPKPIFTIDEIRCIYRDTLYGAIDVDITDYVVEKKVYDSYKKSTSLLLVTDTDYKRNALYFEEGSNIIKGLGYTEAAWLPLVTPKRAIINVLYNALGILTTAADLNNGDIVELGFKVKYKSIEDVKFISEKSTLNNTARTLINNQNTSFADLGHLSNNQKNTVNRLGNPEHFIYGRYTDFSLIPNLSDVYDTRYILTSQTVKFNNGFYNFVGQVTRDYVMKELFTGINSRKRYTAITEASDAYISNHLTTFKTTFSTTENTRDLLFENYVLQIATANMYPRLAMVEFNYITGDPDTFGLAGTMYLANDTFIYNIKMEDNFSVATRFEKNSDVALSLQYTPYVDSNGEFKSIEIILYKAFNNTNFTSSSNTERDAALALARQYPIIDSSLLDVSEIIFLTGDMKRYKDNRDITSETMQFMFYADDDVFIGDQYYTDHPLAYRGINKLLYVYYSDTETYSAGDQDAKGTLISGLPAVVVGNKIYCSCSDAAWNALTIVSWCISDASGNIYLAVNGNDRYIYAIADDLYIRFVADYSMDVMISIQTSRLPVENLGGSTTLNATIPITPIGGKQENQYGSSTLGATIPIFSYGYAGTGLGSNEEFGLVITITPVGFQQIQLTVTFNSNGGTAASPLSKEVVLGATYGALATTSRTYYTYDWYTAFTGGSLITSATTVINANNHTLFAQWTGIPYTIYFEENGGTTVTNITQGYGTNVSAPTAPTKSGYVFAGWYSDSELTTAYTFTTMPANGITLYAAWGSGTTATPNIYLVTYAAGYYSWKVTNNDDLSAEIKSDAENPPTTSYGTILSGKAATVTNGLYDPQGFVDTIYATAKASSKAVSNYDSYVL